MRKFQALYMSKFVGNAIKKQEDAYTISYAKKCFAYSCDMCASRNIRGGLTCDNCPVKEAHARAIERIERDGEPKRFNPNKGCEVFKHTAKRTGKVHVTVVMHFN